MSIYTQSAQQDPKENENGFNWDDIENLIRNTAAAAHVSSARSHYYIFHMANGRAQHNAELFCVSAELGGSSNSKQKKC